MADLGSPRPFELLQLEGVTKDFGTSVVTHVLRGIDLAVEPGEFLALTGPSGSGKTTLLNLIGLLDRPTGGTITFQGMDVSELSEAETTLVRGRGIGFVFQFHYLIPAFTAIENVMLPLLSDRGSRDPEMEDRAGGLLDEVGLSDRADYRVTNLSGGQQQRVALARALVMRPELILADEPTGNLDTESSEQVFQLLREFNERYRTAFVIVTHDDQLASRCDRIVHLVDGRVDSDVQVGVSGRGR
ncbi:MAG TPA: ABC transporter ATP-binding protein [Gemmatimonadaceae bacterium]